MRALLAALVIVAGLLVVPVVPVAVASPAAIDLGDQDWDGINDGLEQRLANEFAPVVLMESDESNWPVNVGWFLRYARLVYHEDCWPDDVDEEVLAAPIGTQDRLIGPPHRRGAHCGEDDTGYSHPPHRDITTIATDPDGQVSDGPRTTGYSDQQTFVLPDLPDSTHVGSQDPRDWKTYFHAYPTADGGIMLQYWHLFAYNELSLAGFGNHGGDWDATIHVQLKPDLTLGRVWFSRHSDDHPGTAFDPAALTFSGNTHTLMTLDGGGHAAFASPSDFCANMSPIGGSAVWPNDPADLLNPNKLGAIDCGGDHPGGAVWQTWDGGTVNASGGLTHPLPATSPHGGLVNLGEYNPCDPVTCNGSRQASTLLAGEFHPLNGQDFLRFEGKWGDLPHWPSTIEPPRGPVFQGMVDTGSEVIYTAWYNQGANTPANPTTSPWKAPPHTSHALAGPIVHNGSDIWINDQTTVSLSSTTNPIATRFGSTRTFYRVHRPGELPADWTPYTGPFTVPGPDGYPLVDYYSVDALSNQETSGSVTLAKDATAPAVGITAPAAINYPHSATITLDYAATDGPGVGVDTTTATLDGASTVGGHDLHDGTTIDLLTELSLGTHTFALTATDRLGNRRTDSVTFTIIVTPQSIKEDVSTFVSRGEIAPLVARALLPILDTTEEQRTRGHCDVASNLYRAFIKDTNAFARAGKISERAARTFEADATYLIDHCP